MFTRKKRSVAPLKDDRIKLQYLCCWPIQAPRKPKPQSSRLIFSVKLLKTGRNVKHKGSHQLSSRSLLLQTQCKTIQITFLRCDVSKMTAPLPTLPLAQLFPPLRQTFIRRILLKSRKCLSDFFLWWSTFPMDPNGRWRLTGSEISKEGKFEINDVKRKSSDAKVSGNGSPEIL